MLVMICYIVVAAHELCQIWLLIWKGGHFQATLGKVTIQIDKVVTEGVYSGLFSLNHDSNKDGSSRTLEIDIIWSNSLSNDGM